MHVPCMMPCFFRDRTSSLAIEADMEATCRNLQSSGKALAMIRQLQEKKAEKVWIDSALAKISWRSNGRINSAAVFLE